jgi:hypothetical protein
MPAPIWVIPYSDQPPDFWEEVQARFGDQVRSVYFPIPGGVTASGRPPQPDRCMDSFLRHAPLAKSVLVNPIVLDRPAPELAPIVIEKLKQLQQDFGVNSVTVVNLELARLIKQALPGYHISASTLMGLGSPAQVLMASEFLDCIVPDNRLLRDLNGLKRLRRAFKGELRLIVNEACLPGCPYRTQHFYEMAYSRELPESLCRDLLEQKPWLRLTGAWVLPRHLFFYDGLYDSLKLAGRVTLRDRSTYLRVLDAYVNRREIGPAEIGGGPASPLEPIPVPDDVFSRLLDCDKNCVTCNFCRSYYAASLDNRD